MTLPGLVLLVILTSSDAANRRDSECDDCNDSGPWWPLFKPSQIIHSEFPEHAQYKSQGQGKYIPFGHGAHYSSQEHVQYNNQQKTVDGSPNVVILNNDIPTGIDSPVKSYKSDGKHRLEWNHYGDISRVTTVPDTYNSLETRSGVERNSAENYQEVDSGHRPPPNSLELAPGSQEGNGDITQGEQKSEQKDENVSEKDTSLRSQEENFFEDVSFFDEKLAPPRDNFPDDFEISKESSFSGESNELFGSHKGVGQFQRPVATSYSAISSFFGSPRPVPLQHKDLLHPDLSYNDVSTYIQRQRNKPVSRSQISNGNNITKQYLVHERQPKDPGVLVINHVRLPGKPSGRSNQPSFNYMNNPHLPYATLNHPVYRYAKNHGGLLHHYQRSHPLSGTSTLRWQDVHPELRNRFPFKQLQPQGPLVHHEMLVHHVIPTKDPFADNFWKESKKIESLKPPPLDQTLYFFKKKPNNREFKRLGKRQGHSFVYIVRRNKRLS